MAQAFPTDLFDVQQELLDAAAGSLDYLLNYPDLRGAPERQYVAPPGDFVLDCEKLIVNSFALGEMDTGPGGAAATRGGRHRTTGHINQVGLRVVVGRDCIPVGSVNGTTYTPPSVTQEEEASAQLNADGWALWNGIFTRLHDEEFLSRCTEVFWEAAQPIGPSGAYAGWQLTFRVRLAGYKEPLGS